MSRRSDLRAFLSTLDRETLVDMLCEQADRDEDLRQRLDALRAEGEPARPAAEDTAGRRPDGVQFDSVLDTVTRLLDSGTSADVTPLARRTADRLVAAVRERDDPSPHLLDRLDRALALYARACAAQPPPVGELAEWLVRLAFERPGRPEVHLADFADALGDDGLAQVSAAVDAVLAESRTTDADPQRMRIARGLRLEIAEITSDVDTVVSLLSEELPRLDVSLRIVRVLRAAGRHSEAIAHAAKALGNGAAHRAEGAGEVVEALERVRTRQSPVDTSDVEAALSAQRFDEAWKAANGHEPSDVIPLYRDCVERLIDSRNPQAYERAAEQLRRLRLLYRRAGASAEFSTYLADLVARHKRKTRLRDELRKARVALPKVLAG
ncbi:hypothetical protein [Saccharomonospora sp. NB11]|uniref:hypothetical protein n=1 Tax=Saccharomonospora sp. NB11 TaxID=1642298 RepID=UPI0018D07C7D|nr:hypothetical protein [Saccharomonospora sp. NB11]